MRQTPIGAELRIYLDGALWWSRVYRPGTGNVLAEEADRKRGEFLALGWDAPSGGH